VKFETQLAREGEENGTGTTSDEVFNQRKVESV